MNPKFIRFTAAIAFVLCSFAVSAQISGTVFRDFNGNGVKDNTASFNEPFVSGITVNVYNAANALVATATTSGTTAPNYSFTAVQVPAGNYRVEFSGLNTGDFSSSNGTANGTSVQFITAPSTTASYAINAPDDYWNNTTQANPDLIVVAARRGTLNSVNGGFFTTVRINNNSSGPGPNPASSDVMTIDTVTNRPSIFSQTGALFGMAAQRKQQRIFASSVLRRMSALGPQGSGGIYILDKSGANYNLTSSFTLQGVTPSNGGTALNFGSVTRVTTPATDNNYLPSGYAWTVPGGSDGRDNDAFAKAATMSYGDIEADPNSDKIYMINLFERRLIVFDATAASATLNNATPAVLAPFTTAYNLTALPGWPAATGAGNTVRPYAVKIYKGRGYIGVVSDAMATQLASDLRGYVLQFDPANIAAGFTTVITINFSNYNPAYWKAWPSTWAQARAGNGGFDPRDYPTPIIAGIEFNEDGSMDIGIKDRWGDQGGSFEFNAENGATGHTQCSINGDLLHACWTGTGWVLEGTAGSCPQPAANVIGPGVIQNFGVGYSYNNTTREWYSDRSGDGGNENNIGGMTKIMGSGNIVSTVYDPMGAGGIDTLGVGAGAGVYWSTQGVQWNNVTTGVKDHIARVIANGSNSLDKSNGMGDIEVVLNPQPIQIGNRVWNDADADGIQDAGETGISGVTVQLMGPGADNTLGTTDDVVLATATTDANGNYYFTTLTTQDSRKPATWTGVTNILPGFNYQVRIATGQAALSAVPNITVSDAGTKDIIDSDGLPIVISATNYAYTNFNTANTNHNFDFGFRPALGSISNKVWNDLDKDGIQDGGAEIGVAGVTVTLYDNAGAVIATTKTDANGDYIFNNLPVSAGGINYQVGFTLPSGYAFSPANADAAGVTGANNSDANVTTGRTANITLTNATPNVTYADAGIYTATGTTIGNFIWNDLNANGIQDAGEPGIAGVTVTLYNSAGVAVATAITDNNGQYVFNNVPPGAGYTIGVTPPIGFSATGQDLGGSDVTDSDINPTTFRTAAFTVTAGQNNLTLDAGLVADAATKASLGNKVWNDLDNDGIQDAGEPGVAGVTVQLYTPGPDGIPGNGDDVLVGTRTTDVFGNYIFNNLDAGNYYARFSSLPSGFSFTTANAGTDIAADGNVTAVYGAGSTNLVTLLAGDNNMTVDAGIRSASANNSTLGNFVWYDTNKNGVQDATETTGVPGVTVILYLNGTDGLPGTSDDVPVDTTFTDANGNYLFTELANGNYNVGFSNLPTGYILTTKDQTLSGGNENNDSDAGIGTGRTGTYSIGAPGTNITIVDAGIYQDASIGSGKASLGNKVWNDLDNDGIQDAGEPGIAGVTVTLYAADGTTIIATTTTNALGEYIFTNLNGGDYVVGFTTPSGYNQVAANQGADDTKDSDANPPAAGIGKTNIISLAPGQTNLTVDAGFVSTTPALSDIGNRVWVDANNNGIQDAGEVGVPGVSVTLYDANGNIVRTTATDNNGEYLFADLPAGTYQVGFANLPAGFVVTTKNAGGSTAANNSDVTLTNNRTDAVTLPVSTTDPNWDLGINSTTRAAIGDLVWNDTNGNGVQDASEAGVPGITVTLYDNAGNPVATTVTDANGNYLFTNVIPGTYTVGFSGLPSGMGFTTQDAGGNDATDSDANPSTGRTATFTVVAGEVRNNIDAGILANTASVGNFVWYDTNNNGIQDAGEAGVPGVVVILYDAGGNRVASAVTDASGFYLINNVPVAAAGSAFTIGFENLPAAYGFTTQNADAAGINGAANSDVIVATGRTGSFTLVPGQYNPNIDAGLRTILNSLGNKVWRDDNSNGTQDAGEPGVAGVTVTLYGNGPDGNPGTTDDVIVGSTVTDAYGNYLFTNLPDGNYNVKFTLPANYNFTSQVSAGDNQNNTNSDPSTVTGRTGTINLTAGTTGENDLTIDAGIIFAQPAATSSIGNKVWYDANGDGVQDAGEAGISGVTVTLYDAITGNVIAVTKTDASGNYIFNNLPNGSYSVGFTPLPGTLLSPNVGGTTPGNATTNSDADPTWGRTGTIVIAAAGTVITGIDAGLMDDPKASLGDLVWNDLNSNGIQDAGEPGIPGVAMALYYVGPDGLPGGGDDVLIQRDTTDANGNYLFSNLDQNTYFVTATVPAGYNVTARDAGTNDYKDSDFGTNAAYPGVQTSGTYSLLTGQNYPGVDMGIRNNTAGLGSIGDKVWMDANSNGIQDGTEIGVAGVTVSLLDGSGNPVNNPATGKPYVVVTDVDGNYKFVNLPAGSYQVNFSNLPTGTAFTTADAAGSGAPGSGTDGTTDSDVNPVTGRTATITLAAGANITSVDAGITPSVPAGKGSLGNKVWVDADNDGIQDANEQGVPNVTVELLFDSNGDGVISGVELTTPLKTTATDAQGNYLFTDLNAGVYQVRFVSSTFPAGYALQAARNDIGTDDKVDSDANPASGLTGTYTLAQGQDNLTVDAGIYNTTATNSIGDKIWIDTNGDGKQDTGEPGMPGVTVNLVDALTGKVIASVVTDATGNYFFGNIPNGNYAVQVIPPVGYNLTTQFGSTAGTNLTNNSDFNTATGKSNVISLTGGTAITDLDAGLVTTRAAIGDKVWLDANSNGTQDATETGISGVTVTLYRPGFGPDGIAGNADDALPVATAITDANGNYLFSNLTPGGYELAFTTIPGGMEFTQQNTAGDNGNNTNSDANPLTGRTGTFTLIAGETDLTADAGIRPQQLGSVGDFVWFDANSNGIQDAGEAGVPGVVVTLRDNLGNVVGTTITDGNGAYLFTNVPAGTGYTVTFSNLPSPASFTSQTNGTATGSDAAVGTGTTPAFTVTAGQINRDIDAGILNFRPLPVYKLEASAVLNNNTATINWFTVNEVNTSRFEVERSIDNRNFTTVGTATAAGNNPGTSRYTLNDNVSGLSGVIYYRIKLVDIDGRITYSNIVAVRISNVKEVKVWPNPFAETVTISLYSNANEKVTVRLVDNIGKTVYSNSYSVSRGNVQLNLTGLSKLPKGVYNIQLVNAAGEIQKVQQLIKQ